MNLDDFKATWNADVGDAIRLNARATQALLRSETALGRHRRSVLFELLLDAVLLLAIGSFLAGHVREPRFFVPALALHLFAIAHAGASIRQLVHLQRIEPGGPVVAMQKQLERMRIEWIRVTKWTLIAAPLLWTPLLIVALQAFLGIDAWAVFDTAWIAANFAFGVAFLAAMLWVSRRFGARMRRSPRMQRLMDDLAGRSLQAAARFLEDVARFEAGDATPPPHRS